MPSITIIKSDCCMPCNSVLLQPLLTNQSTSYQRRYRTSFVGANIDTQKPMLSSRVGSKNSRTKINKARKPLIRKRKRNSKNMKKERRKKRPPVKSVKRRMEWRNKREKRNP